MVNKTQDAAIVKLLKDYADALNASDVSKIIALYTTDGTIMPQGAPLFKGQAPLKATYEGLFKAVRLNVEYYTDDIIISGNNAYARTHSKGETTVHAAGQIMPVDNKELFVLQREEEQWKIAVYIFNNNK